MIPLIDLGVSFLQMFLGKLSNQTPTNVVSSIQAAVDALLTHRDDLITKANLEAQRG